MRAPRLLQDLIMTIVMVAVSPYGAALVGGSIGVALGVWWFSR